MTALEPGRLTYVEGGREHHYAIGGGFLQVADNRVIVLADTAEAAADIDVERAQARLPGGAGPAPPHDRAGRAPRRGVGAREARRGARSRSPAGSAGADVRGSPKAAHVAQGASVAGGPFPRGRTSVGSAGDARLARPFRARRSRPLVRAPRDRLRMNSRRLPPLGGAVEPSRARPGTNPPMAEENLPPSPPDAPPPPPPPSGDGHRAQVNIEDEMRKSYLDYSMSVIIGRALPDVRDGLKPVHRRVLYAMHTEGLHHNKRYSKCAGVVGEVLKKYHPHGDASVYDALVRLAQEWNLRYPLIDGQGNFGSVDGDPAAAYRYTECRLERLADFLLADIDKETVDWGPNFDDSTDEPLVLPTRFPNLLVNGSAGIAVGMATNIPPHNMGEVLDAVVHLIDNPKATVAELMRFVPGPGLPDRRHHPGPRRHPRRLREGARHDPGARARERSRSTRRPSARRSSSPRSRTR